MNMEYGVRYAITFGEVAVLHIGSEELGKIAVAGYTVPELNAIRQKLKEQFQCQAQIISLSDKLPQEARKANQAAVLYIPGAVDKILGQGISDRLYIQQQAIEYDTKYFSARRQKTQNKIARHNIVFSDFQRKHSEDYKQFSVRSFENLKHLAHFRELLGKIFGEKAKMLPADGNKYYEEASGIGFHGDTERKIVICLSLGRSSIVRYYWRQPKSYKNVYGPTDIHVHHGDIYIMSEKASGYDAAKTRYHRLVHAAGSIKFIGEIKNEQTQQQKQKQKQKMIEIQ